MAALRQAEREGDKRSRFWMDREMLSGGGGGGGSGSGGGRLFVWGRRVYGGQGKRRSGGGRHGELRGTF